MAQLAEDKNKPVRGKGFCYQVPVPKPRGFFLVLPSSKATLLVKPVASGELLLPINLETTASPSDSSISYISDVLNKVKFCFLQQGY